MPWWSVTKTCIAAAVLLLVFPGGDSKRLTADFPRTVSLYEGSDVKILGVPVGEIETVTPVGSKVRVEMVYDAKFKVPADAKSTAIADMRSTPMACSSESPPRHASKFGSRA